MNVLKKLINKKWLFKLLFLNLTFFCFLKLFLGATSDVYLFICNSDCVSEEDLKYIREYGNTLSGQVKIVDSKNIKDAAQMCQALKNSYMPISNNIKGIQIFGTREAVPSFEIGYEIDIRGNTISDSVIDTAYEDFFSDFFYSNFDSKMSCLKGKTGINTIFVNNLDVSFEPKWPVSRLMLKEGEIAPFIKKCFQYSEQVNLLDKKPLIVSFSNPILVEQPGIDDMGYFIKNQIDKNCNYLKDREYKLYGVLDGCNKVIVDVEGDFEKENVEKENQNSIIDLFINCHGENDKFIKMIAPTQSYANRKFSSFMDRSNVNSVLKHNYYTLTTWVCFTAKGLDNQNIIYDMLRYKCINAMAATTIISNNGTDNTQSFEKSRNSNNFYCFFYEFFRNLNLGNSRSQSFFNAQKVYSQAILDHKYIDLYQYQILNLLSYHYLGLLNI